ncbi:hypothetical protein [Snuella sedimenti]|uniref:Uncharacterized protein n=1 Tax=Snuella sedimenti TaxID=2798802 RepID=A0A8J7IFX7_9FLAO|nr:hypothetical protein [Snuella sedimenti]MBJ6368477.1 hypothetical protein [Snuella sedimenti]
MSKELPQPQQSEEVDLGQLFKLIGNAFDRFFKFIASIFIGIYSVVLLLLIHFYKRFVWYAGAVIIGVVVGFVIDMKSEKLYGANMFVETNFNSARQVYENIKQFHQLANVDKDSVELGKRLGISTNEAAKLKGFYIQPDLNENDIAEKYSAFYSKLDSLSRMEMTYDRYKESLTPFNYKIHQIGVAATDKAIYKKIEKTFAAQISDNLYLNELVEVNKDNLEKKEEALATQVKKTDSLVNAYLKIRVNESDKEPVPGAGTNLYMGNAESSNLLVDESKIIEKRLELEEQRRQVNKSLVEQKNVINVLAGFPGTGYDIREWYNKMKYLIPIILFAITLSIFTFIGIGKYLEKQSNLLKTK